MRMVWEQYENNKGIKGIFIWGLWLLIDFFSTQCLEVLVDFADSIIRW